MIDIDKAIDKFITYYAVDQTIDGYLYRAGYYWCDETSDDRDNGPFATKQEAIKACKQYMLVLMI